MNTIVTPDTLAELSSEIIERFCSMGLTQDQAKQRISAKIESNYSAIKSADSPRHHIYMLLTELLSSN